MRVCDVEGCGKRAVATVTRLIQGFGNHQDLDFCLEHHGQYTKLKKKLGDLVIHKVDLFLAGAKPRIRK